MAKSANLYARIEPDVKEQAEAISDYEESIVTVIREMYRGRDTDRHLIKM